MTDAAPPPDPGAAPTAPSASSVPAAAGGPIGESRSPAVVVILSIITFGIYFIYWAYKMFDDLKNFRNDGVGGVIGLIITLFVGIVTPFLLANEVEKLYAGAGETPPVTTATGFWILLPLIGGIIWQVKVQGALNGFWEARGATPA